MPLFYHVSNLRRLYLETTVDRPALVRAAVKAMNDLLYAYETGPTVHHVAGHALMGDQPAPEPDNMPQDLFYHIGDALDQLERWMDENGMGGD